MNGGLGGDLAATLLKNSSPSKVNVFNSLSSILTLTVFISFLIFPQIEKDEKNTPCVCSSYSISIVLGSFSDGHMLSLYCVSNTKYLLLGNA